MSRPKRLCVVVFVSVLAERGIFWLSFSPVLSLPLWLHVLWLICSLYFKKYIIYLYLEKGERREKKRKRNINV